MVVLVNSITEFLGELDPMHLTKHGAPQDEYEPEATSIVSSLEKGLFSPTALRSIFVFWFSEETCPWKTDDDPQLIWLYQEILHRYNTSSETALV